MKAPASARYPAQRFFPSMLESLCEPAPPERSISEREQAEQEFRANETRRAVQQSQIEAKRT